MKILKRNKFTSFIAFAFIILISLTIRARANAADESAFEIKLMGGKIISSKDMKTLPGGNEYESDLFKVAVVYTQDAALSVMRRTLRVCGNAAEPVQVDSVDVAIFENADGAYHGGRGQPVFTKTNFYGLESPIGYNLIENGKIVLRHYPSWLLAKGECADSYTAVIGSDGGAGIEESFRVYVDSIRYSFKSNLHYNSWFDIRSNNMSTENFANIYKQFKANLSKYDMSLDYFVVDDGWQNKDSIWESTKKTFPDGFGPLRGILETGGTRFGLWMPLSGYLLNPSWGEKNGYEVNDDGRYYCMAGPKFNKQLRARIRELVEKEGVRYFKHDFNYFECYWPGEPYPHTTRHSFEANVNAEAALLDYIHEVNPDVFLNVTSNMWLSPWWLMHADTIWMHAGDYGYNYAGATLEPREWAMTYVDAFLYQRLVTEGARFPMNAIMTHGIIDGVLNRLGGENESFRTWADNVILYFGRGVYMRELYISPQLLNDKQWAFLSAAAKWAKSMDNVFRRTEWVGGDPNKGEAYGYHHTGGGENWYVLRNPDIRPQKIKISLKQDEVIYQVYPIEKYSKIDEVILRGHELQVLRIMPRSDLDPNIPMEMVFQRGSIIKPDIVFPESSPNVTMEVNNESNFHSNLQCKIQDQAYLCNVEYVKSESPEKAHAYVALFADSNFMINKIEVDGKELVSNTGIGWRLFKYQLPNDKGEINIRISFKDLLCSPFAGRIFRIQLFLEEYLAGGILGEPVTGTTVSLLGSCAECQTRILPPLLYTDTVRRIISTDNMYTDFEAQEIQENTVQYSNDLLAKMNLLCNHSKYFYEFYPYVEILIEHEYKRKMHEYYKNAGYVPGPPDPFAPLNMWCSKEYRLESEDANNLSSPSYKTHCHISARFEFIKNLSCRVFLPDNKIFDASEIFPNIFSPYTKQLEQKYSVLPNEYQFSGLRTQEIMTEQTLDFTGPEFPPPPPPTENDLKTIKAAKLRIRVFGSRSYDVMRQIMLNGRIVSTIPINDFPHDFWQEHVIDLPLDALGAIKLENRLVVRDMTSDTYKFTDVQLAVQLADGTWRNSSIETRLQYKGSGWEYAEGKEFDNSSRPITLKFE